MSEITFKKKAPRLKGEKERKPSPFINMEVDSVVDIEDKEAWPKLVKQAHALATKKKWKIISNWLGDKGRIRRIF